LNHFASSEFWSHYRQAPEPIRELADQNFLLLKANPGTRQSGLKRLAPFGRHASASITAPLARIIRMESFGIGSALMEHTTRLPDSGIPPINALKSPVLFPGVAP
jgi:hypothetical protein